MKRIKLTLLFTASLIAFFCACTREVEMPQASVCEGETDAILTFSTASYDPVTVGTKATLGIIPESRVINVYLFIFNSSGERVYMHYFDVYDAMETQAEAEAVSDDSWWRTNTMDTSDPYGSYSADETKWTNGGFKIRAPRINDARLYAIANINADMLRISSEALNMVSTEADLLKIQATLKQLIPSRNGYFPMTASSDKIGIDGTNVTYNGSTDWTLRFERLDTKVQFYVRTATDNELLVLGAGSEPDTLQTIKSFEPESWQVINLPVSCNMFNTDSTHPNYDDAAVEAKGYFNTDPVVFETMGNVDFTYEDYNGDSQSTSSPSHGFSFYMLENRESSNLNNSISGAASPSPHLREMRKKESDGTYSLLSGDMWQYAPQYATYVIIKGVITMDVDVTSEAKTQELTANVTYIVHLGDKLDFSASSTWDDYNVKRNTYYTYTLTIKGAQNISLEVTSSSSAGHDGSLVTENQPGAMGQVSIAKESTFTFDAHYGQRVFCFDADKIAEDAIYWYVKTPFGKEGIPPRVGDKDVPAGYDYDWVHFKINTVETTANTYGVYPYKQNNQPYPGDQYRGVMPDDDPKGLMNIVQFTEFMRKQATAYRTWKQGGYTGGDAANPTVFIPEFDQEIYDWAISAKVDNDPTSGLGYADGSDEAYAEAKRYRLYVTIFVDEFYYLEDPITGEDHASDDYWKQFVNQPNRMMFILCDSDFSLDGDSNATGSVITIRQHAIQTPYNLEKESLMTAWGAETVDETYEKAWFYNSDERWGNGSADTQYYEALPVTSNYNGLYNSAILWNLNDSGSWKSGETWDTYIDFDVVNDANYVFMKNDSSIATMRYSCLMRNRDNDGDGVIDADELHWYMASTEQVFGLFLGGQGLSTKSVLFPKEYQSKEKKKLTSGPYINAWAWRLHYVTSTVKAYSSNLSFASGLGTPVYLPEIIWGEEGTSVSGYRQENSFSGQKYGILTLRCIRNLGLDNPNETNILDETENVPERIVTQAAVDNTPSDKKDWVYTFDATNINEKSRRFYSSRELEPANEQSEMCLLSDGFETGPYLYTGINLGANGKWTENWMSLVSVIEEGGSYCPAGYRMPNLREAAVMMLYCDKNWFPSPLQLVSTYYSFGPTPLGNGYDDRCSWGFGVQNNMPYCTITLPSGNAPIRCVRDISL